MQHPDAREDDENGEGDQEDGQTARPTKRPHVRRPAKGRGERITEEDLQAMARYMIAKEDEWRVSSGALNKRWTEFAEHPEVCSLDPTFSVLRLSVCGYGLY